MTITSTNRLVTYPGQGSTGPYAYPFFIFQNADLAVSTTDANGGIAVLRLGVDYTMTGAANSAGGTVTLTVALAVGLTLTLQRTVLVEQLTDLRNQGEFFPAVYEDALDYGIMVAQQLTDSIALLVQDFATVGSLQTQVTTNTTDITALTITVTNHSSSISTITTEIVSIDNQLTVIENQISGGLASRPPVRVPTVYTTPGATSHVVSAQCTGRVEYELWGGGGSFNFSGPNSNNASACGGGGAYAWGTEARTPGAVIAIVVGAAGIYAVDGTDSSIDGTKLVAGRGDMGDPDVNNGGGPGGIASGTLAAQLLENGFAGSECAGSTVPGTGSYFVGESTKGGDSPHGGNGAQHFSLSGQFGSNSCVIENFVRANIGGGGVYTADLRSYPANGRVIVWEFQ